jgi:predicted O-methyltransferase YrrM
MNASTMVAAGFVGVGGLCLANYVHQDMHRPFIDYVAENYPYPLKIAEIGVFWGSNAMRMMNRLDISELYLIDPYTKYEGYSKERWLFPFMPTSFEPVLNFLATSETLTSIIPFQMTSEDAASYIPSELDGVYIDGNHAYEYVQRDIELYYPKVKSGGIIGGHDIDIKGNPLAEDVQHAVFEFADENNLDVFIDPPDWWYVKP